MKNKYLYLFILLLTAFLISCSRKEIKDNNLIAFLGSEKYALSSNEDKAYFLDSISKKIDNMPNDTFAKNLTLKLSTEYYYLKDNKKIF